MIAWAQTDQWIRRLYNRPLLLPILAEIEQVASYGVSPQTFISILMVNFRKVGGSFLRKMLQFNLPHTFSQASRQFQTLLEADMLLQPPLPLEVVMHTVKAWERLSPVISSPWNIHFPDERKRTTRKSPPFTNWKVLIPGATMPSSTTRERPGLSETPVQKLLQYWTKANNCLLSGK